MLEEIKKAQEEKFVSWLTGNSGLSVKKILHGVEAVCLEHKKAASIPLEVGTDGESYTDGKKIHVSLMNMFLDPKYSRAFWLLIMKTSTAHECQHVNSTSLKSSTAMAKRFGQYMNTKYGFNASIGENLAFQMFNIVEDGRIECIVVHKMPGFALNFRIKNDEIRVLNHIDKIAEPGDSKKEFSHFVSQCLSYAKCGGNAIGVEKYSGHRMEHKFAIAKPYIDKALAAYSCGECIHHTEDMLIALSDYFNELLKADSDFANFLEQLCQNMPLSGGDDECEFNQDGENNPLRIFVQVSGQEQGEEKKEEQVDGSDGENSSDGKDDPKGGNQSNKADDSNKGHSNESSSDGDQNSQGDASNENQSNGKSNASSATDGKPTDGNAGDAESDGEASSNTDGEPSKQSKSKNGNKANSGKNNPKKSNKKIKLTPQPNFKREIEAGTDMSANFDNLELQNRGYTESELRTALQIIEAEQKVNFVPVIEKPKRQSCSCKTINKGQFEYTEHIIACGVEKMPQDLMRKAMKLRKGLEKLIRMKKQNRINTRFGEINTRALYKLSTKEDNFFQQINRDKKPSIAFYILIDNSGSMESADKSISARRASAVMEEAFTDFAKVKIVLFCSAGGIQHYVVRDWDKKGKHNASINSLSQVMPCGGNKDGYSIRIATQDLLQRREKQKVLLVLSDGLPSDYHGQENGIKDVRDAVNEAHDAGITVVGIPFGNAEFIQHNMKQFQQMYSTVCAADPDTLVDVFGKIFKRQILKSK